MLGVNECEMYARSPDTWGGALLMSFTPFIILAGIVLVILACLVWELITYRD